MPALTPVTVRTTVRVSATILLRSSPTADCPDPSTPAGPDSRITCRVLVLPEDRARPEGRQVELPVLTFRPVEPVAATAEVSSSPVVYLHGGPGGGAVEQWATWSTDADALGTDLVVYDQRGGGAAVPRLECPEHVRAVLDALSDDADPTDERASVVDALEQCHDRLSDEGVDLDHYDVSSSVADLDALRRALGVERLRLVASSYGTRLALEYAAAHPDRVAALVLDSIDPPGSGHPGSDAEQVGPAITRLIDACDTDPACATAHPDLRGSLDTTLARADTTPLTIAVTDPTSGEPGRLVLTGDDLRAGLFAAMYDSELVPLLPLAIEAVARGDDALLASVGPRLAPALAGAATGALMSAICADRTEAPPPTGRRRDPCGGRHRRTHQRRPVLRRLARRAHRVIGGRRGPGGARARRRRRARSDHARLDLSPPGAALGGDVRRGSPSWARPDVRHAVHPRRAAIVPRGSDSARSRLRRDDGSDALRVTRSAGGRRRVHRDLSVEILSTAGERSNRARHPGESLAQWCVAHTMM